MGIIYCGKQNSNKYYIKEADISISSIQELAYFIYNFAILISNSFITKSLIVYIDKSLNMPKVASNINEMNNKKISLADILTYILANSNYYNDDEIGDFRMKLLKLLSLPEDKYIERAGDKLFGIKKYEKAITYYEKIVNKNIYALKKLAFCFAKLQFYDLAANYLGELYSKTKDLAILKDAYFCLKLSGNVEKIYDFERNISEEILADWEYEIVTEIIKVRKGDELKNIDEMFLMGREHIKDSMKSLISIWKEKYRYIG